MISTTGALRARTGELRSHTEESFPLCASSVKRCLPVSSVVKTQVVSVHYSVNEVYPLNGYGVSPMPDKMF